MNHIAPCYGLSISRQPHYKGIPVYEASGLNTPFVAGFVRPVIYLPSGLEENETCQCLAHEYTHIRRKDYLVKQAAFLLSCVYWFQPAIWLAFHLMSRDMEMSCDEMTLQNADLTDRKAYSSTLVRLSSKDRRIPGCPTAFSGHNTASRVKNILNLKKPALRRLVVCGIVLGVFAAGLLTNPPGSSVRAEAPAGSGDSHTATAESIIASAGILYDPPLSPADTLQAPAPENIPEKLSDVPMENPYPAFIRDTCQELQEARRMGETENAAELQREIKDQMTSYWTYLVKEQRELQNRYDDMVSDAHGSSFEESAAALSQQIQLQNIAVNQAKAEMNHMDKIMDAIEGTVHVVNGARYESAYTLNGILASDHAIVRSLPKEDAPEVDMLSAGDAVSIISFGKYMLQEDEDLKDFLLSDAAIQQEYHDFAVILYHSEEDGGKTTRKGYISTDSLDISGNPPETFLYWIGKTWSEAFCSGDGTTLYQMAADRKALADWIYIQEIRDADPVQVEWNTSLPGAGSLYRVILPTKESSGLQTAFGTGDVALQYFVQTPESTVWTQRQDLTISSSPRQLQQIRRISDLLQPTVHFSEVRNYEQVTGCLAYQDAYLTEYSFGPAYFDFKGSGYAALYNSDPLTVLINQSMSQHMTELAETISEKYLNLSGGTAQADIITMRLRDDDRITGMVQLAYVEYTFDEADESGQNRISIPMYYDSTDHYWCLWVPGQNDDIDTAMQKMQEALLQFTP